MSESPQTTPHTDGVRPPEPSAPPILGHALSYARDPLGFVEQAVAEHGPIVSFTIPRRDGVLLADPDAIHHVLTDNAANYRKGDFQRQELEGLLGDGLLISEGDDWKSARTAIQPAFNPGQIADYASTMVECTDQYITDWQGDTVDIATATFEITLTISRASFTRNECEASPWFPLSGRYSSVITTVDFNVLSAFSCLSAF